MVFRLTLALSLALAAVPAFSQPQDKEWWEGKIIDDVQYAGFSLHPASNIRNVVKLPPGDPLTKDLIDKNVEALFKTGYFDPQSIKVKPERIDGKPERVLVVVTVQEYPHMAELAIEGQHELDEDDLKPGLRLQHRGSELSAYALHLDRQFILNTYKQKGFHFVEVTPEQKSLGGGMVSLTWRIVEGPEVQIGEVRFSGDLAADADELLEQMGTQEGGILTGSPFVESQLVLDLDRLKLWYWMNGWQDIYQGDRVYVGALDFSSDRSEVVVTIHVDEPTRYSIKRILVEGNKLFAEDEILTWIKSDPGEPASDKQADEDVKLLSGRYAEKAYIMTRVSHEWIQESPDDVGQLTLKIKIQEGAKTIIGRINIVGNDRTQDEVVRRDLRDFAPGEYFNVEKLERGIQRVTDRGYFQQGKIQFDRSPDGFPGHPGRIPDTRDVDIKVQEGNTGDLRFAAGFSSSIGLLALIQVTQKNFDITDTPDSWEEFFTGNAFVGAGQFFRLRIQPAQRRQSYTVEFGEPFMFGEDFGMFLLAGDVVSLRESYTEDRRGGRLTVEKRWDDLSVDLSFSGWQTVIEDVDSDAPLGIQDLEGTRLLTSLTPGIHYDNRDNKFMPTSGWLAEATIDFAGGPLPGDFDYYKIRTNAEYHLIVIDSEERNKMQRHVLTVSNQLGAAEPYGHTAAVPIFERFYAGGRGSIRGYRFRGMGPQENGDPVGGDYLALGSVEYSMPFFLDWLRAAAFYDVANLTPEFSDLWDTPFRHTVGVGLRVAIPILGNVPVAVDFSFPLNSQDGDDEQFFSIDIGRLF